MKNEEIIMKTRIQLMRNGKIGTTGNKMTIIDQNQQEVEIDEPAEIHTYVGWKRAGYQVPKGTKAKVFIPIWTYQRQEDGSSVMFQRNAPFFTPDQVEKIEEVEEVAPVFINKEDLIFA